MKLNNNELFKKALWVAIHELQKEPEIKKLLKRNHPLSVAGKTAALMSLCSMYLQDIAPDFVLVLTSVGGVVNLGESCPLSKEQKEGSIEAMIKVLQKHAVGMTLEI